MTRRLQDLDPTTRDFLATAAFGAAIALVLTPALLVETRTLNGANLWIKPVKFALSFIVHGVTLAWLAQLMSDAARRGWSFRLAMHLFVLSAVFEIGYISVQAMQGEASHFNFSTPLHSLLYLGMGVGALILVFVPFLMGLSIWRRKDLPWTGFRLGAVLALVIAAPLTTLLAGYMSASGGHFVGAPNESDASGLFLFGWSTTVGDLRPAHFVALHMIQAVPIVGWLADRVPGLGRAATRAIVGLTAVLNVALALLLFWRALQGEPFWPF